MELAIPYAATWQFKESHYISLQKEYIPLKEL